MKHLRLLLVDDEKAFNFLNRRVLKNSIHDCWIAEALNGQQALDIIAAEEKCPDVILLDLNMPLMDGFEFMAEYAKGAKCRDYSKIFILTSSNRQEDKLSAFHYPFVKGYFDKPLTPACIQQIIASG